MSQFESRFLRTEYRCFSKLNLGLEVLSKRPDGYHELNTLFVRIEQPSDKLIVAPSVEYRLTISDAALDTGESNLITKAIRAFSTATGKPAPPLHLHLEKHIPMGAGLGGGSSNAAQALHIANDYFNRPLDIHPLIGVGSKVGADVPFFVSGWNAAQASGIGEELTQVDLQLPYSIVIVKPESVSISTREAYSKITPSNTLGTDLVRAVQGQQWAKLHNDFEAAIFPFNSELARIKQDFLDFGAIYASMSGSGSAIFGFFDDTTRAEQAMQMFKWQQLPCWLNSPQS